MSEIRTKLTAALCDVAHDIDDKKVVIHFSPRLTGHNATDQLLLALERHFSVCTEAATEIKRLTDLVSEKWQTTGSMPLQRTVLIYGRNGMAVFTAKDRHWREAFEYSADEPTHWCDLPSDPSTAIRTQEQ